MYNAMLYTLDLENPVLLAFQPFRGIRHQSYLQQKI